MGPSYPGALGVRCHSGRLRLFVSRRCSLNDMCFFRCPPGPTWPSITPAACFASWKQPIGAAISERVRPAAVFPDAATSPSSPVSGYVPRTPAAATGPAPLSPAPVTPAMAWLEAGCKSPDRSSSEGEGESDRRGLAQPPPTRALWADASGAEGEVEYRPQPPAALTPRGSVSRAKRDPPFAGSVAT